MHVVWKRPDGFHGADPSDFKVVNIGNHSKIWLHNRDVDNFPFRISGGWKEELATARLNRLVNLLTHKDEDWTLSLLKMFNDSMVDDPQSFFDDLIRWVGDLRSHLKGDTWEIDIMSQALLEVTINLNHIRQKFFECT